MSTKAKKRLTIHQRKNNGAKIYFMKTIFILFASILVEFVTAQENPWTPKGENPWKQNPNNEFVIVQENDTLPTRREMVVVENDSIQKEEVISLENASTEKQLLQKAGVEAEHAYDSNGDFGAGFGFGLLFNFFGVIPDMIYVANTSKKETAAIKKIERDSRFNSVNQEKLDKKVRSKIKTKKAASTIIGTVIGSVVQIGVGIIILTL